MGQNNRIYTSPDEERYNVSVFLAGGITGCPDWQSIAAKELCELCDNITIFNPRRAGFDVNLKKWENEQIRWEDKYLGLADVHLFWFPKEGQCMITLFELGKSLVGNKPIVVGAEEGYVRKSDVTIQTVIEREKQDSRKIPKNSIGVVPGWINSTLHATIIDTMHVVKLIQGYRKENYGKEKAAY